MSEIDKTLKNILSRIEKLEKKVFGDNSERLVKANANDFSGVTGGIRLLVSKKFFKGKHLFVEIKKALSNEGYHSSRQAINQALKLLSKNSGPLIKLKEKGSNYYAIRK